MRHYFIRLTIWSHGLTSHYLFTILTKLKCELPSQMLQTYYNRCDHRLICENMMTSKYITQIISEVFISCVSMWSLQILGKYFSWPNFKHCGTVHILHSAWLNDSTTSQVGIIISFFLKWQPLIDITWWCNLYRSVFMW